MCIIKGKHIVPLCTKLSPSSVSSKAGFTSPGSAVPSDTTAAPELSATSEEPPLGTSGSLGAFVSPLAGGSSFPLEMEFFFLWSSDLYFLNPGHLERDWEGLSVTVSAQAGVPAHESSDKPVGKAGSRSHQCSADKTDSPLTFSFYLYKYQLKCRLVISLCI